MLQNKIYQNFFIEILKTFLIILLGLSVIALTVRAVNFLDLIVDSGYPVTTYFKYSFLNLFGIAPKFIPLAYLVSILIFIVKHRNDSEFIILWTSGVKKIQIVNLFLISSFAILIFYLFLSALFSPFALNKSRGLLNNDQLNSFLPTVKSQQFSNAFENLTYIVEKKVNNEVKNIFLYDTGKNLKNLSADSSSDTITTIAAEKGLIKKNKLFLFDGQIIFFDQNKNKNNMVSFEQFTINLDELNTQTIKKPKLQETSTIILLKCFLPKITKPLICTPEAKKEILPQLFRRLVLPFYIPIITLISSFLLLKKQNFFSNRISIFIYNFILIVLTELIIRFTGLNYFLRILYLISPFLLFFLFYFSLFLKFSKETKSI